MARATTWLAVASALAIALPVSDADAAVVAGRVLAIEGSTLAGAPTPVSNVLQPFVDAVGMVAFAGTLTGGESFLCVDDQIAWLSSDETAAVTSVQNSVGTDATAEFVLRATIDGELGLWTDLGALGLAGDPAPGFPLFPTAAFVGPGDCTMDGTGAISWRATIDITNDGSADVGGLFHAPDGAAGSIEALYRSGGMVDGVTLHGGTTAITDEFAVSDDGTHVVARLTAAGNTFADQLVVIDDEILVREGDVVPSFPLEHWRALDLVGVNDSGNVLFTGNTDADPILDEFVAYNGDVQVHEGDVLDGVAVAVDLRFVAINDRNNAAIGWATTDNGPIAEVVFFACDAADIAGTAEVLVAVGDTIDVDGDAIGDLTVADIVGAGNEGSHVLGDPEAVYLELDLDPDDLDAIVAIPVTCCGNGVTNGGEACDDGNDIDDDDCANDCMLPPDTGTTSGSSSGASSESTGDGTTESSSDSSGPSPTSSGSDSTGPSPTSSGSDSTGPISTSSGSDSTGPISTSSGSEDSSSTAAQSSSTDDTTSGPPGTTDGTIGDTTGDTTGGTTDDTTSGTTLATTGLQTTTDADTESDGDGAAASADGCGCATPRSRPTLIALSLLVLGLRRRRASA